MIFGVQMVVISQENGKPGSDRTVLESIVQKDHIQVGVSFFKMHDTPAPLLIDCDLDPFIFLYILKGFIPDVFHIRADRSEDETVCFPAITPAESGYKIPVLEKPD